MKLSDKDPLQPNADQSTIKGFGNEWKAFDQSSLNTGERDDLFNRYFRLFLGIACRTMRQDLTWVVAVVAK